MKTFCLVDNDHDGNNVNYKDKDENGGKCGHSMVKKEMVWQ